MSSFEEDLEGQERKATKRTDLDTGGAAMKLLTRDILKMKRKSSGVLFGCWRSVEPAEMRLYGEIIPFRFVALFIGLRFVRLRILQQKTKQFQSTEF